MFRLDRVIKPWKEAASLNAHINLYGFWNETTFFVLDIIPRFNPDLF